MMREMKMADVDAVLAIEQAVQPYPWSRGNFVDALDSGYICRVEETGSGDLSGYAILMPLVDEGELLTIGVAQAEQRKGLGRAILSRMLDLARERNIRYVFLEVRRSNAAAMGLYRSAGFREIGVRYDYYRNSHGSEDAITMACEVSGPSGEQQMEGKGETRG